MSEGYERFGKAVSTLLTGYAMAFMLAIAVLLIPICALDLAVQNARRKLRI